MKYTYKNEQIYCTKCGEENKYGASFCCNCGARINDLLVDSEVSMKIADDTIIKCEKCGEENRNSTLYCCNCGVGLNDSFVDSKVSDNTTGNFIISYETQINDLPTDEKISENITKNSIYKCKKCGSKDWKLASFVYNSGTSDIELIIKGESNVRRGLGHETTSFQGESEGSLKSKLAEMCAPPTIVNHPGSFESFEEYAKKTKYIQWFVNLMFLVPVFDSKTTWTQMLILVILFICSQLYFGYKKSSEAYLMKKNKYDQSTSEYARSVEAYELWQRNVVCLRCGTMDIVDSMA
jgi:ribosomal protein L37E